MPGFNIPNEGDAQLLGLPITTRETARRHRWKFSIEAYRFFGDDAEDNSSDEIVIYAHKSTRPVVEIDPITIHHSQDEIYFPGKNRWLPIDISFYEVLGANTAKNVTALFIYNWWSKNVVNIEESVIAGKDGDNPIKRTCYLAQLDGKGNTIHEYVMYGCWPTKVSPEDLNYDESTICEISLRLQYDKAIERHKVVDESPGPSSPGPGPEPGSPPRPPPGFTRGQ